MPMWATEKSEHVYTLSETSPWANTPCMRRCGRLMVPGQTVMENDSIVCHVGCS